MGFRGWNNRSARTRKYAAYDRASGETAETTVSSDILTATPAKVPESYRRAPTKNADISALLCTEMRHFPSSFRACLPDGN
jgi:hypothetical protein